jgi:phage major head subunit gpT-like protein
MIGKPLNPDVLLRTTRADFIGAYNAKQSFVENICMVVDSDSPQEVYAFFGAVSEPVITTIAATAQGTGAGARTAMGWAESTDINDYQVTLINGTATLQVPFKRETWEDQKLDQLSVRAKSVGEKAKAFEMRYLTSVIEANATSYDGVNAFFADAHEGVTSAAKDNNVTYNGTLPNVTVAEFEDIFAMMLEALRRSTDDKGSPVNIGDLDMWCMVDPANERAARAVLEVGPVAGQTGNSGVYQGRAKVIVNSFMTTTAGTIVYLFETSSAIKPFVYQKREPWDFKTIMDGDDWEKRDIGTMKARARLNFIGADFHKAVKMTVT